MNISCTYTTNVRASSECLKSGSGDDLALLRPLMLFSLTQLVVHVEFKARRFLRTVAVVRPRRPRPSVRMINSSFGGGFPDSLL